MMHDGQGLQRPIVTPLVQDKYVGSSECQLLNYSALPFGQHWHQVAMNNIARLQFELSVHISRTRLKPHRGTAIVEY